MHWLFVITGLVLLQPTAGFAAANAAGFDEARIRALVESVVNAKDKKIAELEARMKQLESLTKRQQAKIDQLESDKPAPAAAPKSDEPAAASAADAQGKAGKAGKAEAEGTAAASKPSSPLAELILPRREPKKDEEEDSGPKVGGFMDVLARTKGRDSQPFNLGVVELDLDRIMQSEHFAASAALDWFPYGTTPNAQIGAAFVDFHLYDDAVPVRGRIFQEPGFHLQAGQFDLPFAADYQFFASKDRLTITPPITTVRIQQSGVNPSNGGFNSTGVRSYGNWKNVSYAIYYVDSVFSNGSAIGGRIGYFMNNPYRVHKRSDLPIFDLGLSALADMDNHEHRTDTFYAADASFNYGPFRLLSEFYVHDGKSRRRDGNPVLDEYGYHVTFITQLDQWLKRSMYVFGRYQEWNPTYDTVTVDGSVYRVERIPALAVGFGYKLNDYLTMKLEYSDTLGHRTKEPGFQRRVGMAQLVATF